MVFDPNSIDNRDPAWLDAFTGWGRLLKRWHRAEVRGIERIPQGPALVVGNHSAGVMTPDTWILLADVYARYGIDAIPYGLGHDLVMKSGLLGPLLAKVGGVRAAPGNALRLFEAGRKIMVYPGGDLDSLRPFRARDEVRFGQRRGFMRLALRAGVPIVPVVAAGTQESLLVIDDLPWLARLIRADRWARLKVWPLALTIPWGLTLGPIPPFIPYPARILIEVLEPSRFERSGPDAADDEAYVESCARDVHARMQACLTRLARKRREG